MPIYEGTSQIQSLMAMKDTLGGILKNPQRFLKRLAQARWRALSARDALERRRGAAATAVAGRRSSTCITQHRGRQGASAWRDRPSPSAARWSCATGTRKRDFAYAMLHAERLTRLLADEADRRGLAGAGAAPSRSGASLLER